jgi:hypothetical protein
MHATGDSVRVMRETLHPASLAKTEKAEQPPSTQGQMGRRWKAKSILNDMTSQPSEPSKEALNRDALVKQFRAYLHLAGTALHLFAATALGIFMATVARSMPQFGMLTVLVLLPLEMLSGSFSPRESMPEFVQILMQGAPTTHFVALGQSILFRGAGFAVVWPQFLTLLVIGGVFFAIALTRFRKTISQMA